jgi:hypothetical protein
MKAWYRRLLPVLVTLILLAVGCRTRQDEPALEDRFEVPGGPWGEQSGDGFDRGYASGGYFFEIARPNWFTWATSAKVFGDTRVEIDAHLASGPDDNHTGIICRLDDAGAFYYLAVSPDGYYGIFRRLDSGSLEAINESRAMVYSPAIKTGNEENHIEAICEDDRLSLSANGELLETVIDGALRKGRVGFGAGSGANGNVRIGLDNLVVYAW